MFGAHKAVNEPPEAGEKAVPPSRRTVLRAPQGQTQCLSPATWSSHYAWSVAQARSGVNRLCTGTANAGCEAAQNAVGFVVHAFGEQIPGSVTVSRQAAGTTGTCASTEPASPQNYV